MVVLGIDYGLLHCGIALGIEGLAEPVATVATKNVISHLEQLVGVYKPQTIVLGISEGEMAKKTRAFAQDLESRFAIPLVFQDETLTSQEVRQEAARLGMKRSKREAKIDHLVAARILQDYLDTI